MKCLSSCISFLKYNNSHSNGADLEGIDIHNFQLYFLTLEKIICFAVVFTAPKNVDYLKHP